LKAKLIRFFLLLTLLIFPLAASGCSRLQPDRYANAALDALCGKSTVDYEQFTGQSAADLSRTREKWLQKMADSLIRQAGCSAASDKMKERTVSFLSMVYSKAQYSCSPGSGTDKILVEYSPMTIFQDSAEDLKEYNSSFAAGNKAGKYKKLSSQQYADSCLDGMLTILESRLGSLSYGKAVQEEITVSEDDENRRTLDPAQLEKVMEGMLPLS